MTRFLFLDIDGVLNTPATWGAWSKLGYPASLEPVLVARARRIAVVGGAKVVLSSTWRLSSAGYVGTVQALQQRGWPDAMEHFVGETPSLGGPRGREVNAWLSRLPPGPVSFVLLDDDDDAAPWQGRLVHVDHRVGLQDADVERALDLLLDGVRLV